MGQDPSPADDRRLLSRGKERGGRGGRGSSGRTAAGNPVARKEGEEDIHYAIRTDLDYFKQINDKYGHHAGDLCLVEVVKTIKSSIRQQDLFARIGGEEFVIGMPDTTVKEANNITERIRIEIEKHKIELEQEHKQFNCTASFGIAALTETAKDVKSILINADKALYKAKELGRNRVQLFA